MADTDDDIYNDPDTIGNVANEGDQIDPAPDKKLTDEQKGDLSQSIYTPEKDTTDLDDRGGIDELDHADGGEEHDEMSDTYPEDSDPDSDSYGDMNPDEDDGTER